jgi:hypothetical protein
MDDQVKTLIQQYIDVRRKQRSDLMKELGLTEHEAEQAVATLELYYHIEASEPVDTGLERRQARFSG